MQKGGRAPREPAYEELYSTMQHSDEKSFAQKRKENLLSRAQGGRPREADVAVTAVLFAAKMKRLSLEADKKKKERGEGEKTWKEKRKEAYLRTHGAAPPKETDVAVTALTFAAKLKSRSSIRASMVRVCPLAPWPQPHVTLSRCTRRATWLREPAQARSAESLLGVMLARNPKRNLLLRSGRWAPPRLPPTTPRLPRLHPSPGRHHVPRSLPAQDALLRRQGIKSPREPEVALTAVTFAAKMKRLSSRDDSSS